jgi:hypothetical protein
MSNKTVEQNNILQHYVHSLTISDIMQQYVHRLYIHLLRRTVGMCVKAHLKNSENISEGSEFFWGKSVNGRAGGQSKQYLPRAHCATSSPGEHPHCQVPWGSFGGWSGNGGSGSGSMPRALPGGKNMMSSLRFHLETSSKSLNLVPLVVPGWR